MERGEPLQPGDGQQANQEGVSAQKIIVEPAVVDFGGGGTLWKIERKCPPVSLLLVLPRPLTNDPRLLRSFRLFYTQLSIILRSISYIQSSLLLVCSTRVRILIPA